MENHMTNFVDGFVLPVPADGLDTYREVAQKVAKIWIEHGALTYMECVGPKSEMDGTRSFSDSANARDNEVVIFGWVTFESREARDYANKRVAEDPRMSEITEPLSNGPTLIFDASRMVYGGFESIVNASSMKEE